MELKKKDISYRVKNGEDDIWWWLVVVHTF